MRNFVRFLVVVSLISAVIMTFMRKREEKELCDSVAVIGGSDGPTAIFIANRSKCDLL